MALVHSSIAASGAEEMATMVSQEYLAESRQPNIYAAEITTYAFALLAVSLRFWSRRIKAAGYWIDDWLILVAMVMISLLGSHTWTDSVIVTCDRNVGHLLLE